VGILREPIKSIVKLASKAAEIKMGYIPNIVPQNSTSMTACCPCPVMRRVVILTLNCVSPLHVSDFRP
jgi:hypothetical protein